MAQENMVGWFEIPVSDMDRAVKFYESIFGQRLERQVFGKTSMAWWPMHDSSYGSGGGLVHNTDVYTPGGTEGPLIYFTSPSRDIDLDLVRIEQSGGKIMMTKTLISEDLGYMAVFYDSEGNRIALHSRT